jgi:hypothetical protein
MVGDSAFFPQKSRRLTQHQVFYNPILAQIKFPYPFLKKLERAEQGLLFGYMLYFQWFQGKKLGYLLDYIGEESQVEFEDRST